MKFLGSARSKVKKDKNGKNLPYLELTEVVLIHCNVLNNSYQQIQGSCIHLFKINCSFNIIYFTQKFYIFKNF